MGRDGVNILLNTRVIGARLDASNVLLETRSYKTKSVVSADCVLMSVGRAQY
jgi:pyruvate/2-oxoglutarate dehydrogenase complex dihydrolipoamide dehydrogenase (E3) component